MKGPRMNDQLKSDLESADPIAHTDDTRVHDLVARMATLAREATITSTPARTPWWKRRRTILPLGIVGFAALTGGAILIPLSLSVNGTQVQPDAQIPIAYTTDTGVEIGCRYWLYFGEPSSRDNATEELAEYVADHDWTGIGQSIYEEAIANPFVPGHDGGLRDDTAQARDEISLARAASRLIEAQIPTNLRGPLLKEGIISTSTTDCKGELH